MLEMIVRKNEECDVIVGALLSVLSKEEIKSCSWGKITGIGEGDVSFGADASLHGHPKSSVREQRG